MLPCTLRHLQRLSGMEALRSKVSAAERELASLPRLQVRAVAEQLLGPDGTGQSASFPAPIGPQQLEVQQEHHPSSSQILRQICFEPSTSSHPAPALSCSTG